MGSRLTTHLSGIALPIDPDRLLDDLAANTAAATTSDYTEAGPRPGASSPDQSTSTLVPVVSGAQASDFAVECLWGGNPGGLVEVGYTPTGASQAMGYTTPQSVTNWIAVYWNSSSLDYDILDAVTVEDTQKVVMACTRSGAAAGSNIVIRVYDPGAEAWSSVTGPAYGDCASLALCALPSGRLLMLLGKQDIMLRSDDDGATWETHALQPRGVYGTTTPATKLRMVALSETEILLLGYRSASASVSQFSSIDGGSNFSIIATGELDATDMSVAAMPGGRAAVAWVPTGTSYPTTAIVTTSASAIADATATVVLSTACDTANIVALPDGALWIYTQATATPNKIVAHFYDGAAGWLTRSLNAAVRASSATTDYMRPHRAVSSCGSVLLLHTGAAGTATTTDGSVGALTLGAWEDCTIGHSDDDGLWVTFGAPYDRAGFGDGTDPGLLWFPLELPHNAGWTLTGAGTFAFTALGAMTITTSSNTGYETITLGTNLGTLVQWVMHTSSGGALTSLDVGMQIRVADGTDDYQMDIRWTTTGFRLYDANAASALATITVDTASDWLIYRAVIKYDGTVQVLYRSVGDRSWTLAYEGTLTDDTATPNAAGTLVWGNIASASAVSYWRMVGFSPFGLVGSQALASGTLRGRRLGSDPAPLGAELAGDDGRMPWLHLEGGAGALGDTWTVATDHDYPIEHLMPTISPSPDERWRSTQTIVDEIIAWDFGDETWIGDSLALVALGCNFQNATLEYYNGSTWVTSGTLDLATGFDGVDYSIAGDCVTPGASTSTGGRYVHEGELANGHIILSVDGGGGTQAFKIRWNTAGSWIAAGQGTPRMRILCDGDLSGVDATGSCTIVWPNGVLLVHLAAILRARRWRVVVGGGQDTSEGYYEAGCLVPMAVRAFGAPPDWGWSQERAPNVSVARSRYGTTRARKLGPTLRSWSMGWTSGTDVYDLRHTTAPSYTGSSNGLPLMASEDVAWMLEGLLELSRSGAVPVVALAAISDSTTATITDPSLFLYGRLVSSARVENAGGTEGDDEILRISSISVEGIV